MLTSNKSMSRRHFVKATLAGAAAITASKSPTFAVQTKTPPLRLGGPVKARDPQSWVAEHQKLGYRACYCPVKADASDDVLKAYTEAARKADIVIAEVGAWSNPISPKDEVRRKALEKCRTHLHLADRLGARCCVNISGSRAEKWAAPAPANLTDETFDMIVETTRAIIDYVKPKRTYFALETMPWAFPDSPDSYLRLIKAIDRKRFAVHLDPVNLVNSPRRYFGNGKLISECFKKLGPHIRSCHAKDIILENKLTTHLNETRPGLGGLDYSTFLKELSRLPGVPLMLEHLENQQEYRLAADHIRSVAAQTGLSFG